MTLSFLTTRPFLTRRLGLGAAMALGTVLAGCTPAPRYPLLSPVELTQSFGYDDLRLAGDRFEVTYVTPPRQGFGSANPAAGNERALGFDMALWRASEIALALGYPGFTLGDTHSDANVVQESGYYDGGHWGPLWGGWGGTYWPPENTVQVSVRLSATLVRHLRPGDYSATDAINRLRAAYPGAEGIDRPVRTALSATVPPLGGPGTAVPPVGAVTRPQP